MGLSAYLAESCAGVTCALGLNRSLSVKSTGVIGGVARYTPPALEITSAFDGEDLTPAQFFSGTFRFTSATDVTLYIPGAAEIVAYLWPDHATNPPPLEVGMEWRFNALNDQASTGLLYLRGTGGTGTGITEYPASSGATHFHAPVHTAGEYALRCTNATAGAYAFSWEMVSRN